MKSPAALLPALVLAGCAAFRRCPEPVERVILVRDTVATHDTLTAQDCRLLGSVLICQPALQKGSP